MSKIMRLPARLSQRHPDSHKGDFGHIFILGGSLKFSGAAVLCAEAALRTGSGLVTLGIPKGISKPLIKIKPGEVMLEPLPETKETTLALGCLGVIKKVLKKIDILVIGPGLGQNKSTQELIRRLIKSTDKPIVVDADGLNALAGCLDVLRTPHSAQRNVILTPHPGEMSRLLGISVSQVQRNRVRIAKRFARDFNVTVVLKGHNTVVADKNKIYVNKTGNPGMSTAGSGDVLTGMVAALLGQGLDAFNAAKYGVYLHGLAGDLAAKAKTQIGMIASDIIAKIPEAIKISS